MSAPRREWPALEYEDWRPTRETLHRWLQIVGKLRATQSPWLNHSWQSPLYVTARGLGTGLIPGIERDFSVELDFRAHSLSILCANGEHCGLLLRNESVSSFYHRFLDLLDEMGLSRQFDGRPDELADRTPFHLDHAHATYEPAAAERFWQVLVAVNRPLSVFRSRFVGKCSPVHFFWGALDLAVTRFSGRRAPTHPGGVPGLCDRVVRDAYSHEVSSCGFWPGDDRFPAPAFYSYAYPEPEGFRDAAVEPEAAFYEPKLREFVLPYEEVRRSQDPEATLLRFLETTYAAAAGPGGWDRELLEKSEHLARAREWQERKRRRPRAA